MTEATQEQAIYAGGPLDGQLFTAESDAVVHVPMNDVIHRYIRTTQHREIGGESHLVFNYDGEEYVSGGTPGVETR
jgi:hypothetical protein